MVLKRTCSSFGAAGESHAQKRVALDEELVRVDSSTDPAKDLSAAATMKQPAPVAHLPERQPTAPRGDRHQRRHQHRMGVPSGAGSEDSDELAELICCLATPAVITTSSEHRLDAEHLPRAQTFSGLRLPVFSRRSSSTTSLRLIRQQTAMSSSTAAVNHIDTATISPQTPPAQTECQGRMHLIPDAPSRLSRPLVLPLAQLARIRLADLESRCLGDPSAQMPSRYSLRPHAVPNSAKPLMSNTASNVAAQPEIRGITFPAPDGSALSVHPWAQATGGHWWSARDIHQLVTGAEDVLPAVPSAAASKVPGQDSAGAIAFHVKTPLLSAAVPGVVPSDFCLGGDLPERPDRPESSLCAASAPGLALQHDVASMAAPHRPADVRAASRVRPETAAYDTISGMPAFERSNSLEAVMRYCSALTPSLLDVFLSS
ncbi:hypothetical protein CAUPRSCDRAFT_10337 [Caulochytrium protostelioides]|uniref:Uncharacterized protein n=1 Tax=Caulochytrium protostelioides TaxID=1555241 RepID=A0A4P9X079_9FUNG|nr:hypothetical protein CAUPRSCDRAFT_10337 [Caulochytrium protostelioides]